MKRFILIFIAALSLLLELAFFSNIKLFGVTPDVFLMFLIAASFVIPAEEVIYMTFFGALFLDLFSSGIFGFETLALLIIICFIMLLSYYIFSGVNFVLLILSGALATAMFYLLSALSLMASGFRIDLVFYVQHFLVSKIVINSIFVLLFYFFLSSVWERVLSMESRARLF